MGTRVQNEMDLMPSSATNHLTSGIFLNIYTVSVSLSRKWEQHNLLSRAAMKIKWEKAYVKFIPMPGIQQVFNKCYYYKNVLLFFLFYKFGLFSLTCNASENNYYTSKISI